MFLEKPFKIATIPTMRQQVLMVYCFCYRADFSEDGELEPEGPDPV